MLRYITTVVALALAVTGCATDYVETEEELPAVYGQVTGIQKNATDTYDIFAKWVGTKPKPSTNFVYSNDEDFDMQLHMSMRGNLEAIAIEFADTLEITASELPVRLTPWLEKIEKSGGVVAICPTKVTDPDFMGTIELLSSIILRIAQKADSYATYAPAANYNAAILVDAGSPNDAVGALFVNRKNGEAFSESCTPIDVVKK